MIPTTPSKPFTGGGDVVSGNGYHFAPASPDSGVDTGVLIFLGGAVLVALAAMFLVVATKPRTRNMAASATRTASTRKIRTPVSTPRARE